LTLIQSARVFPSYSGYRSRSWGLQLVWFDREINYIDLKQAAKKRKKKSNKKKQSESKFKWPSCCIETANSAVVDPHHLNKSDKDIFYASYKID
jgi:hypothetical protein